MSRAKLRVFGFAAALVFVSSVFGQADGERVAEPVFGRSVMLYRAGPAGAEPVVLIHGLGQNAAKDWSELIPALATRYEVFALDLPGFRQSDKGNELYSPDRYVRVIESVIGSRVSRPFVLIGHSMGGAVAIAYAAAYPKQVSRLIVVDAAGILHRSVYAQVLGRAAVGDAPWFDSFLHSVLTRVEPLPGVGRALLAVPELRLKVLQGDPNAIAAYALVDRDFSRDLRSIKAPTLVIWGAADKVAPLRTGQLVAALSGGRLVVLDGTAHAPMLERPQRFNALVLDEIEGRLQLEPYALPRGDPGTDTARCEGQAGQVFTGNYKTLVLEGCSDVQIVNARIGTLTALDSSVQIVNSHVYGGIVAKTSRIEVTAGWIGGSPPLALSVTSVDAAGTRFESDGPIVENRGRVAVALSFSVSEATHPPRTLHRVVKLRGGKHW